MSKADRGSQILVLQPFSTPSASSSSVHGLIAEIKQSEQEGGSDEEPSPSDVTPWHISNKYYEADVEFKVSSVSIFEATHPKAPTRTRRTAKMAETRGETEGTAPTAEGDEELKKRVRDVFEALDQPSGISLPKSGHQNLDEGSRDRLQQEFDGVDAVMMVVDSNQPLRQHRRLLSILSTSSGDTALLSGFDLAVSIVVALPSSLNETTGADGLVPTMEQLDQLYTGEGWEFIDLDEQLDVEQYDDLEGEMEGVEELQGIARIREALQTHTWPNLTRKNDRLARKHSAAIEGNDPTSRNQPENLDQVLSSLQLDLDSLDAASEAEPTKQDEELAEAFLKRILASQASTSIADQTNQPATRSVQAMQQELEKFLEDEDTRWPLASETQSKVEDGDEEAWSTNGPVSASDPTSDFDDDFCDFVEGANKSTAGAWSDEILAMPASPLDEEQDMDFNLDDVVLMRALEKDQTGSSTTGSRSQVLDFESTLSVVMAQAERVRSIADRERRREEAASVALALTREHP